MEPEVSARPVLRVARDLVGCTLAQIAAAEGFANKSAARKALQRALERHRAAEAAE